MIAYIKWIFRQKIIEFPTGLSMNAEKEEVRKKFALIYESFKSYKHWTLLEFLSLVYGFDHELVQRYSFIENELFKKPRFKLFKRAILDNVKPVSKNQNGDDLYSPFALLEFFKKKGFPVRPELEFTKKISESGKILYFWDSDIQKQHPFIYDSKNVQKNDHIRSFELKGDFWDVTFKGRTVHLNDNKPLRYILEALKHPGDIIRYADIIDIVSGTNKTHETNDTYSNIANERLEEDEGLIVTNKINDDELIDYTERNKNLNLLQTHYGKLKNGTEKDKKGIKDGIKYFESEYHIKIIRTKNGLTLGRQISRKHINNQASIISKALRTVLKNTKVKFPQLHEHFKLYIKLSNGLIYNPSENSPQWEIKDTN